MDHKVWMWIGFLVAVLCPIPSSAQVLTRDQFLKKFHSVYYDPGKDGLKGFRCEVKSEMVDKMFSSGDLIRDLLTFKLNPNFQLVYDRKELRLYPEKFQTPQSWKPTPQLDQYFGMLNDLRTIVWGEVYGWCVFGFLPREGNEEAVNVGFAPLSDGYRVQFEDKEARGTFHFQADLTLDQVEVKLKGKKKLSVHLTYEKTPKGLLLHSCQWDYKKFHYEAIVHYTNKDDYFVPDEIKTTHGETGSKDLSVLDVLHFEKYRIDW